LSAYVMRSWNFKEQDVMIYCILKQRKVVGKTTVGIKISASKLSREYQ